MFASKPLKLSILTLVSISLFFGGILAVNPRTKIFGAGVNAQNTGQSTSTASIFTIDGAKQKINHIWQDIKGGYIKLLNQSKDIQIRESAGIIKEEWKKEIDEMKQDIVELWRRLKERIKLWKTP